MKIEFLNVWSGKTGDVLAEYLEKESKDVDIFCFQEADKTFSEITDKILPNFRRFSSHKFVTEKDIFDQANHVSNILDVLNEGTVLEEIPDVGLGLMLQVNGVHGRINILNIHGVSRPKDKLDSDKRLEQSQKLIEYMNTVEGGKIIGGDFNLNENTKSVAMFEKNGYINLIKEFGIRTTRNRLVWERYPETPQYYSDFVFVSPEIMIRNFEVIENEVSDHLPLILEIE
jgi:endonuclease/exonuclease/phosphatase family metal-dependent hydrolase